LTRNHAPSLEHELHFLEAFGAVHAVALGLVASSGGVESVASGQWLSGRAQAAPPYAIAGSLREPLEPGQGLEAARPNSWLDGALGIGEACRWFSCLKVYAPPMSIRLLHVFA
jgi:hypothetical protein